MQALALWDMGIKRWNEKFAGQNAPETSPRATINRRDLFTISHPSARHLWRDLHVRDIRHVAERARTKTYGSKLWSPYAALSSAFVKVGEGNAISWLRYRSLWSVNWKQLEGPATQASRQDHKNRRTRTHANLLASVATASTGSFLVSGATA